MQNEFPKFKIGRGSCANSLHTASATTSEKAAICEGSWDLSQSTSTACTKETLVQTRRKMNLRYIIERDKIRRSEKIYKFLLQDEESNIQETPVANDEEGTGLIPTVIATIIVLIIVAAILIEHCRKMATLRGGSLISPDSEPSNAPSKLHGGVGAAPLYHHEDAAHDRGSGRGGPCSKRVVLN